MKQHSQKILLVDDHTLFAHTFIKAMQENFEFSYAHNANQMRLNLMVEQPQLVLLDLQLSDGSNGLELLDEILESGLRVIVLSGTASDAEMRACYYIGAHGFLDKRCTEAQAMLAMQIVLHGGTSFSASLLEKVKNNRHEALPIMRRTELAVLNLLCAGQEIPSNNEIAEAIFLSLQHVKNLTGNLFSLFQLRHRKLLAAEAKRRGFVSKVTLRRLETKGRRKVVQVRYKDEEQG